MFSLFPPSVGHNCLLNFKNCRNEETLFLPFPTSVGDKTKMSNFIATHLLFLSINEEN